MELDYLDIATEEQTSWPGDTADITFIYEPDFGILGPSAFESISNRWLERARAADAQTVTLDFRAVLYFDIATVINISILLNSICKEYKYIYMRLPDSESVLYFLCTMNFHGAVANACSKKFSRLLSPHDILRYNQIFTRLGIHVKIIGNRATTDLDVLNRKGYFAIKCFDLDPQVAHDSQLIIDFSLNEAQYWQNFEIQYVLNKHLMQVGQNQIANDIFYECITNALRHPGCSKMQIASRFVRAERIRMQLLNLHGQREEQLAKTEGFRRINNVFQIVVWDNGANILQTLKQGFDKNGGLRMREHRASLRTFKVKVSKASNKRTPSGPIRVQSDVLPDNSGHFEEWHWILASFFPGVTADLQKPIVGKGATLFTAQYIFGGGMGLTNLLDTVVRDLGGRLVLRTHDYRFIFNNGTDGYNSFDVEIKGKTSDGFFKGNMIVATLPVKEY